MQGRAIDFPLQARLDREPNKIEDLRALKFNKHINTCGTVSSIIRKSRSQIEVQYNYHEGHGPQSLSIIETKSVTILFYTFIATVFVHGTSAHFALRL